MMPAAAHAPPCSATAANVGWCATASGLCAHPKSQAGSKNGSYSRACSGPATTPAAMAATACAPRRADGGGEQRREQRHRGGADGHGPRVGIGGQASEGQNERHRGNRRKQPRPDPPEQAEGRPGGDQRRGDERARQRALGQVSGARNEHDQRGERCGQTQAAPRDRARVHRRNSTSVPCGSASATINVPPSASTRSAMPRNPDPDGSAPPGPSSRIVALTCPAPGVGTARHHGHTGRRAGRVLDDVRQCLADGEPHGAGDVVAEIERRVDPRVHSRRAGFDDVVDRDCERAAGGHGVEIAGQLLEVGSRGASPCAPAPTSRSRPGHHRPRATLPEDRRAVRRWTSDRAWSWATRILRRDASSSVAWCEIVARNRAWSRAKRVTR